jgi:hypothetical protein
MDNAINSIISEGRLELATPSDYIALLARKRKKDIATIDIDFNDKSFTMKDTAGGISYYDAENSVFRFGRPLPDEDEENDDTLSVYGIGMKRAIFKIGDRVQIISRHRDDGFSMDLRVRAWERLPQSTWTIPIDRIPADKDVPTGTEITISALFPDIVRRVLDGSFEGELTRKIARTYSYFLERVVSVKVNGKTILPADLKFGDNLASDQFALDGVSCSIIAGIYVPEDKFYTADKAGWYVFCNGRAVAFADKTSTTGWGTLLPTFQPKHRPFLGLAFFTSPDPELLPWTTTKASINQESAVWQHALRVMNSVGRQVTSFLDKRYSDDGTEISITDLAEAAGKPTSAFATPANNASTFRVTKQKKTTTSIQITVQISELDEIRSYFGERNMPNTEVGRRIFEYS